MIWRSLDSAVPTPSPEHTGLAAHSEFKWSPVFTGTQVSSGTNQGSAYTERL